MNIHLLKYPLILIHSIKRIKMAKLGNSTIDCLPVKIRIKSEPGMESKKIRSLQHVASNVQEMEKLKNGAQDYRQELTCDVCVQSFSEEKSFKNHCKYSHPGQSFQVCFKCKMCGDEFNGISKLQMHAKKIHEGMTNKFKTKFTCELCLTSFK